MQRASRQPLAQHRLKEWVHLASSVMQLTTKLTRKKWYPFLASSSFDGSWKFHEVSHALTFEIALNFRWTLRRTFLGIPVYFSQLFCLVPNLFAQRVTRNVETENPALLRNRELLSDYQLKLFTKFFIHPFHCTCWFFSSHRMIFHNRLYMSLNSTQALLNALKRKICVDFVDRVFVVCRRLRFV